MPWKLHETGSKVLYDNLRYDRIRFLEERGGEPHLTPYPDPGDKHADIGLGFRIESNWNEVLGAFGFDLSDKTTHAEKDYITRIKALVNGRKLTKATIEQLKADLNAIMVERGGSRTIFGFYDAEEVRPVLDPIAQKNEERLVFAAARKPRPLLWSRHVRIATSFFVEDPFPDGPPTAHTASPLKGGKGRQAEVTANGPHRSKEM